MSTLAPIFQVRAPLEAFISQSIGRPWRIQTVTDLADYACHPAAILSDGSYSVFVKFSDAANGREQFEVELAGLQLLQSRAGVAIPTPLGILSVPGGCLLVLAAVQAVEREARHWRQIGQALARLHQVKGQRFGLERDGYFGPLPQENTPHEAWPSFYAERRLLRGLELATVAGNLPVEIARRVERLIPRLPELCGPSVLPTLLHGDAQQNNFISAAAEAVVIDPAVYYGHPEVDLAFIDYFQPVPDAFFDGYRDLLPIDPGFWERRSLWRLWGYLAAVTVEGAAYLGQLVAALDECSA